MVGWLSLSEEQRRQTLSEAQQRSGINPKAIEKDWWVTLVLKALFDGPYAQYLIFKGGTSLSKCWNLIERFSEDIDIALDPVAFGMEYQFEPTQGHVKRLKQKGCVFTSTLLMSNLQEKLAQLGLPDGSVMIEAETIDPLMPDKDPQIIYVRYKSLLAANPYVKDEVKIEVSVRSLKEPNSVRSLQSLLNQYFPNDVYAETPFSVTVVEPRKTFLEKVFLLHEEFKRPDVNKIRIERMSRHLSDLAAMNRRGVSDQALEDQELYQAIILHRRHYSRYSWFDYETLSRGQIAFLPPTEELLSSYKTDYASMLEQMIYGEEITFEQIVEQLDAVTAKFNEIKFDEVTKRN